MHDLSRNVIPKSVKRIHLIAVCGTGMGALACMLQQTGYAVTGSDGSVYPPMSLYLKQRGLEILHGYKPEHLDHRPDLVVVGNAVSKDNPEVRRMHELGLCYCSMPQALNAFVAGDKRSIVVAGTHGKTTTASMVSWLLMQAGLDISFFIGGILNNFNANYRLGNGDVIVIEGDEYDSAYFDKGPKFAHFEPAITILTSIEFDHADIFEDFEHVQRVFETFVVGLDPSSALIGYSGDAVVKRLSKAAACRFEAYGSGSAALWRLANVQVDPPWSAFDVFKKDRLLGRFQMRLLGRHNCHNALAAIAVGHRLGVPTADLQKGLERFEGVKRRQEVRGRKNGITVIDDFAHHPTAVKTTLEGLRSSVKSGRLVAVFEPRTNTSMRDVFQTVYPAAFDAADLVLVREPPLLTKIPRGERFSSRRLVSDLKARGKEASYFETTDGIIHYLVQHAQEGDRILIMSNGGFDNIHARLLESL